jgi:hypothetical protein
MARAIAPRAWCGMPSLLSHVSSDCLCQRSNLASRLPQTWRPGCPRQGGCSTTGHTSHRPVPSHVGTGSSGSCASDKRASSRVDCAAGPLFVHSGSTARNMHSEMQSGHSLTPSHLARFAAWSVSTSLPTPLRDSLSLDPCWARLTRAGNAPVSGKRPAGNAVTRSHICQQPAVV